MRDYGGKRPEPGRPGGGDGVGDDDVGGGVSRRGRWVDVRMSTCVVVDGVGDDACGGGIGALVMASVMASEMT